MVQYAATAIQYTLAVLINLNKRSPVAPASYFCQNEILYSERVNGRLSKKFKRDVRWIFGAPTNAKKNNSVQSTDYGGNDGNAVILSYVKQK